MKPFLLVLIVFMINAPLLFNKFIGDDHHLIENNLFYSSFKNVPRVFERGYIFQPQNFFSNNQDYGSGCASYRPVLSLTYFLDYRLWGNRPFGYHLTNILIHCLNGVLFYQILLSILGPSSVSFFAALLFGLHPIQSEAVAVVGYRADILAAFFVLCSFYFWIRFQSGHYLEMKFYGGSLIMYFFALFSKESAVMLPAVILFYEQILAAPIKSFKQKSGYYAGFMPVLIFYLYIYIFVFPNSSLYFKLLGGSVINHGLTAGYIGYNYLINLLAPWTIKLLPGIYSPPTPAIFSFETLKIGAVFIILMGILSKLWRAYKPGAFFLLWFVIFYFPVSNLVPLANPMAYRFMYLPSAGLLTLYALFLYKAFNSDFLKQYSHRLSSMFYLSIILICMICTLMLNERWKSDFDVAYTLLEYYPSASTGYVLMGQEYFARNDFGKAREYFEKAIRYGARDPQIDMQLGICNFYLGELKSAKQYFLNVMSVNPAFLDPYLFLGNIYYYQKEYEQERQILEKALLLAPDEPSIHKNLMNLEKLKKI